VLRRAATAALAAVCLAAPAAEAAPGPEVGAPHAILVEPVTGDVLFARGADASRPVASATKLMTALVVLERVSLDDEFAATDYEPAFSAETRLGLRPGEPMSVRDLLRGLLLASANDAAHTLAVRTSGSVEAFVAQMNRRARELGLHDTHYANPIGLDDPANYSSARDLVALTARLRRHPFFVRTVAEPRITLTTGRRHRVIDNRNDLVGTQPHVDGVKTGHTAGAGYVLVGSATRGRVTVLSAVLGDPSEAARDADTTALLRHGLEQLRSVQVLRPRQRLATAAVRHAGDERVALVAARGVTRIVRRGERPVVAVRSPRVLSGPLPAGERVGTVVVRARGRVVERVPLLTAEEVRHVGVPERVVDRLLRPDTLALLMLVAAASMVLAGWRRRRLGAGRGAGTA
jgi:D-alanyl-D-alanine carboxypeptidase (penicillin-binding protein 5/6)